MNPIKTAIPAFKGTTQQGNRNRRHIASVVSADLQRSGLFKPIDPQAFVQRDLDMSGGSALPGLARDRCAGPRHGHSGDAGGRPSSRPISACGMCTPSSKWSGSAISRRPRIGAASRTSSPTRFTSASPARPDISTRVSSYIAESGPEKPNRVKRLAIEDQDGANPSFPHQRCQPRSDAALLAVDAGDHLPLLLWRPSACVHLQHRKRTPKSFWATSRHDVCAALLARRQASRDEPRPARDNSDVYVMDLATRHSQRLTDNPAIDTAPSFSPDSRFITFESDRSGTQQIYLMNADGSNQHRISFGEGRYATPVGSPRGRPHRLHQDQGWDVLTSGSSSRTARASAF